MTEKMKKYWNRLSLASKCAFILLAGLCVTAAVLCVAGGNDRDRDLMDDSYETFFSLDPDDPSDATLDIDHDGLEAWRESIKWTDPRSIDTDADGWSDAYDDAISRAYIPWGSEEFTLGNSVTYVGPEWWLAAGKINGEWDFQTRSWFMSGASSNNLGALYVDLDRATLTNNIVYKLDFFDFPESSLQLDLLNADRECIAPNLFGNLCEGSDERNVIALDVPLAAYPAASTICIRRESGPARVYTSLLYEDFDGDGLDRLQELAIQTSDGDVDSDDDLVSDYDEVFVRHTDPARPDFITDDDDDEESAPTVPGTSISTNNIRFDSILGWWQLNESEDEFVLDSSQYHNHGTVHGSLTHIAGERCYAAYFDGKDNSISVPNSSDYKPGSCLTIGLYAQFGNASVTESDVLMSVPNGASGFAYALYRNSDNAIVFELSGPSGSTILKTSDDYIQTGKWYWIMGTWNGANAVIYVCAKGEDGYTDRLIDSKPHTGPINYDRSAGLSIACAPQGMGANSFYGIIDEPFVLNVATHPAELRRAFDTYTEDGMSFEERRMDYLEEHPEVVETLRAAVSAPLSVMTKGVFLMKSGGPTPEVTITNPTACTSYATGSDSLTIAGSASDDNGITNLVWSNNRGGEGTVFSIAAPGVASTNWSCSVTNLQSGLNRITFSAYDTNGLCGTDRISVFLIPAPPTDGLVLYYPFDSDQTNIVSDASGNGYTGTVSGATFTNAGWDGNAYWFDGTDDYISAGDVLDCGTNANPNLTVAAWIKFPSSLYNSEMWYLGKVVQPSGLRGWCFNTRNGENRAALVNAAGGSMAYAVQTTPSMLDDDWHMICGTFEDGTNFIRAVSYIDGSANNTTSTYYMSNPVTDNTGELWLGARYNGTAWYQGYIDELRIYDRILGADEIDSLTNTAPSGVLIGVSDPENDGSTIYTNVSSISAAGAAWSDTNITLVSWTNDAGYSGSCTGTNEWTVSSLSLATGMNHIVFTATDALTNTATEELTLYRSPSGSPVVIVTNPTMSASYMVCGTNIVLKGLAYPDITNMTWSNHRGGSGTIFSSASPGTAHTNWVIESIGLEIGVNHIVISAWDDNGDVGQDTISIFSPEGITTEGLALYYSFDTDEGSTVTDQSGNGYDGTVSGAIHTNDGKYGGAYDFDGVNDRISAGNVLNVGTNNNPALTVSAWIKSSSSSSEYCIASKVSLGAYGWMYALLSNKISGYLWGSGGSAIAYSDGVPAVNDDNWHLICMVFESTTSETRTTIYIDGSTETATSSSSSGVTSNSVDLWIGGCSTYTYFDGLIDEVRIYTRELSTEEIDSLTNSPSEDIMIEIFSPEDNGATYTTNIPSITIEGAAWSAADLSDVAWTNDATGGSGACTGTEEWSADVALTNGTNFITFTATDVDTNTASDSITVFYEDAVPPTVTVESPTTNDSWATSNQYINVSGTATDNVDVVQVDWSNDRGGSGTCTGTNSWSQTNIYLYAGTNILSITASDAASNVGTDTLTVVYTDIDPPTIAITNPADEVWATGSDSFDLKGEASDNVGLTNISWSNNRGGSGTVFSAASPGAAFTNWTSPGIALSEGPNTITVTAYDWLGNQAQDQVDVIYSEALTEDGLVLYYSFMEDEEGTVSDMSGNGHDGTVNSANFSTNGWQDGAYNFAAGADITGGDIMNIGGSVTAMTACAWLKMSNAYSKTWFLSKADVDGQWSFGKGWLLSTESGKIAAELGSAYTNRAYAVTTNTVHDDQWHLVCAVFELGDDLMDVKLYIDCELNVTNRLVAEYGSMTATNGFYVGDISWDEAPGGHFYGSLDQIRVYNKALTLSEIQALTNQVSDPANGPLVYIDSPTVDSSYWTNSDSITLEGLAWSENSVSALTWTNNLTSGSGSCTGTTSWITGPIALQSGVNEIVVTVLDSASNAVSDTIDMISSAEEPYLTILPSTNIIPVGSNIVLELASCPSSLVNYAEWSGGGDPTDWSGIAFTTRWDSAGTQTVTAAALEYTNSMEITVVGVSTVSVTEIDPRGQYFSATPVGSNVTFTAETDPAGYYSLLEWTGGGDPASQTGGVNFTTTWVDSGIVTVEVACGSSVATSIVTAVEVSDQLAFCTNVVGIDEITMIDATTIPSGFSDLLCWMDQNTNILGESTATIMPEWTEEGSNTVFAQCGISTASVDITVARLGVVTAQVAEILLPGSTQTVVSAETTPAGHAHIVEWSSAGDPGSYQGSSYTAGWSSGGEKTITAECGSDSSNITVAVIQVLTVTVDRAIGGLPDEYSFEATLNLPQYSDVLTWTTSGDPAGETGLSSVVCTFDDPATNYACVGGQTNKVVVVGVGSVVMDSTNTAYSGSTSRTFTVTSNPQGYSDWLDWYVPDGDPERGSNNVSTTWALGGLHSVIVACDPPDQETTGSTNEVVEISVPIHGIVAISKFPSGSSGYEFYAQTYPENEAGNVSWQATEGASPASGSGSTFVTDWGDWDEHGVTATYGGETYMGVGYEGYGDATNYITVGWDSGDTIRWRDVTTGGVDELTITTTLKAADPMPYSLKSEQVADSTGSVSWIVSSHLRGPSVSNDVLDLSQLPGLGKYRITGIWGTNSQAPTDSKCFTIDEDIEIAPGNSQYTNVYGDNITFSLTNDSWPNVDWSLSNLTARGDATLNPTSNGLAAVFSPGTDVGNYQIRATAQEYSEVYDTVSVSVRHRLEIETDGGDPVTSICVYGSATFDAVATPDDSGSYSWELSGGITSTNLTNAVLTVQATTAGLCTATCTFDPEEEGWSSVLKEHSFAVVRADDLKYNMSNDWHSFPTNTLYLAPDDEMDFAVYMYPTNFGWPEDNPVWGGVCSGDGVDSNSHEFSTLSTNETDYQLVTVECGNVITGRILVASVDIVETNGYGGLNSTNNVAFHLSPDGWGTVEWFISPDLGATGAMFASSSTGSGTTNRWTGTNVWISPGACLTNYTVCAYVGPDTNVYDVADLQIVKIHLMQTNVTSEIEAGDNKWFCVDDESWTNLTWTIEPAFPGSGALFADYQYSPGIDTNASGTSVWVYAGALVTNYTIHVFANELTNYGATAQFVIYDPSKEEGQEVINPAKNESSSKDPINTISGDLYFRETDVVLPCPGIPLEFGRQYNSVQERSGTLGPGWTHSYDWHLSRTNSVNGSITNWWMTLLSSEGREFKFQEITNNVFAGSYDVGWELDVVGDQYIASLPGKTSLAFDTNGVLQTISDGWGNSVTLSYSTNLLTSVEHNNGKTLTLSYQDSLLTGVSAATNLSAAFYYNASGQLTNAVRSITGRDFSTTYVYGQDAIVQRINPAGQTYAYTYTTNAAGLEVKGASLSIDGQYYDHTISYSATNQTDITYSREAGDQNYAYIYDPDILRLSRREGPSGTNTVIDYEYDSDGNITNETTTDYIAGEYVRVARRYDSRHNVIEESSGYCADPSNTWEYAWHPDYQTLTESTDPEGNRNGYVYSDGLLSCHKLYYSGGSSYDTDFTYTTNGLLAQVDNPNGHWIKYYYDPNGFPTSTVPQAGPETAFEYNELGHMLKTRLAGSREIEYTPNALGWVEQIAYPDSSTETFQYDQLGNLTNHVDTAGRTNIYTYAPTRKLTSSTRYLGSQPVSVTFDFDKQFNTLVIKDALNRAVESYNLDIQDRPTTVTNVENQTMTITYGLGSFVQSMTRFDGSTVDFEYDSSGNRTKEAYASTSNQYAYYPDGLLKTAGNESGTITNTYNGANRLTSSVGAVPQGTVTYGYYPAGQVSNMTSLAGTTTYANDAAERVTQIAAPDGTFSYAYNEVNGLVESNAYDNGVSVSYEYDILDRVTNIVWTDSETNTLRSFAYAYSAAGMITNQVYADGGHVEYTYDDLDRLTGEKKLDSTNGVIYQKTYTYDLVGNRLTAVIDGATDVYTLGTGNRLASWGASGTVSYADAGNVTNIVYNDGGTVSIDWNDRYEIAAVYTNGSLAETYGYDALGRRVKIENAGSTNYLVYDGIHVVAEVNSSGELQKSYTWGAGVDNLLAMSVYTNSGGTTAVSSVFFYIKDHLGSVIAVVDETGTNVVERYEYDAWGNVTAYDADDSEIDESQIGNRYLWQGREYSWTTGLYNFRARWYAAEIGRWLSKDPIGISGGLNQYVFCGNNPVMRTDPLGLCEDVDFSQLRPVYPPDYAVRLRPFYVDTGSGQFAIVRPNPLAGTIEFAWEDQQNWWFFYDQYHDPSMDRQLAAAWQCHQAFHRSIRQSFSGCPDAMGVEYVAGLETLSTGGLLMGAGGVAVAEGTAASLVTGGFWILVGGEVVWIGVDMFQGLTDRFSTE